MSRIVGGPRLRDGAVGLFISPPGVDADTAADSALLLNATSKVSQLILLGRLVSFPQTVALGLGRSPLVFLVSQFNFSGVIGHTQGPGPVRPSPPGLAGQSNQSTAQINGNGVSVSISSGNGFPIVFEVYSQAFT